MKKFNLFIFIAVIILFSACQKDNITVTLRTAGSLNAQIIDSTGKAFPKVKIHLCTSYYSSTSYNELDSKITDNNGNVGFGTIESGTYYLITDTIKNGYKKYLIIKEIQVISGDSKSVILNPMEYVGNINLQVSISTSGVDTIKRTTLKVVLVNYNDYVRKDNRKKVISKAVAIESCDVSGNVEFTNVPANMEYIAYVYINNTDSVGAWSSNNYIVSKGGTYSGYASVNLSDLIIIRTSVNLTIEYYSYLTYTYNPVQTANVILVNYYDYSNYSLGYASQNTIKTYSVVSGITNGSGVVTFTGVPANNEYYVYVYYNSTYCNWSTSDVYPNPSSANNQTIYVAGSNLGLSK